MIFVFINLFITTRLFPEIKGQNEFNIIANKLQNNNVKIRCATDGTKFTFIYKLILFSFKFTVGIE